VVAADRTALFQGSQAAVGWAKGWGRRTRPVLLQFTNGRRSGQGMAAHLDRWLRPERITRCRMLRLVC
jgi:hypothetical protein